MVVSELSAQVTLGVMSATMRPYPLRWLPLTALTLIAAGSVLLPATARAGLHNITYIARIDGVTTGSQATFVIGGGQTNSAPLSTLPGRVFEANTVLDDPQKAGMQIVLHWPSSANVHCEIDLDGQVFAQVDQRVAPVPGTGDPMNGVLQCGAPISG